METYEIEVRFRGQDHWHRTSAIGNEDGFKTVEDAEVFIKKMQTAGGEVLYSDADYQIVRASRVMVTSTLCYLCSVSTVGQPTYSMQVNGFTRVVHASHS